MNCAKLVRYIPLDLFLDNYQKSNQNISKELYEEIAGFQQRPEELEEKDNALAEQAGLLAKQAKELVALREELEALKR